jgi:acetyltransferase-like isoleucine patch superfamily enzyme
MNRISKIKKFRKFIPYLFQIIYFNFHYLPLKQAIRLPILLYKPHLLSCKGKVIIDSDKIYTGMVKMGIFRGRLFQNAGIRWVNDGGICVFKGRCILKNNSYVHIGRKGQLICGNNCEIGPELRLSANKSITFGDNLRLGWMAIVLDTSYHRLKKKNGEWRGDADEDKEIVIGKNNWFGLRCIIMKGTRTPDYCIFGATSFLNKDYLKNPSYILMAGNPLKVKAEDIWRDVYDDII